LIYGQIWQLILAQSERGKEPRWPEYQEDVRGVGGALLLWPPVPLHVAKGASAAAAAAAAAAKGEPAPSVRDETMAQTLSGKSMLCEASPRDAAPRRPPKKGRGAKLLRGNER